MATRIHDFAKYAKENTTQVYVARAVATVPHQGAVHQGVIEAASALRNWLTHGSPYSRETLRKRLAALVDPELFSADLPTSGGRYLKGWSPGPNPTLPEFTASAQPAGTQPATRNYERRRMLLFCGAYVRTAWTLAPIEET
jgi:hypothetical protein